MLSSGIIRRIGAVPNHYRLGLKANGMTVWDVADEQADELGMQIGQLDFVSHCYLRPRHLPVWRYNLFAMEEKIRAAFRDRVRSMLPADCTAEFHEHGGAPATVMDVSDPAFEISVGRREDTDVD